MDDYTLQQELEALAGNAFSPRDDGQHQPEPIAQTAARWQQVFGLSQDEAVERLMTHRLDLTRTRISDAHWEMVRGEAESAGYDREAYEYDLELQKRKARLPDDIPTAGCSEGRAVTYLVEMSGPLDSAEKVKEAAGMERFPAVMEGRSVEDHRRVELCCVDGAAKAAILRWASEQAGGFEPTILVDPRSLR